MRMFFISCSVTFCCCITTSSTPEIDKKLSLIDREIKKMPYYFGIAGKIAHRFKGKQPATNNCFETHLFGCMATFKCSASHIPQRLAENLISRRVALLALQRHTVWLKCIVLKVHHLINHSKPWNSLRSFEAHTHTHTGLLYALFRRPSLSA